MRHLDLSSLRVKIKVLTRVQAALTAEQEDANVHGRIGIDVGV